MGEGLRPEDKTKDLDPLIKEGGCVEQSSEEEKQKDLLDPTIECTGTTTTTEEEKKHNDIEVLVKRISILEQKENTQIDLEPLIEKVLHKKKETYEIEIRGTETIHMLAVDIVTETQQNGCLCLRPFFYALLSLCFVMVQSTAFYMMIYESTTLPCSAHTDCLTGQYCRVANGAFEERGDGEKQHALCIECEYGEWIQREPSRKYSSRPSSKHSRHPTRNPTKSPKQNPTRSSTREPVTSDIRPFGPINDDSKTETIVVAKNLPVNTECDREEVTSLKNVDNNIVWINDKDESYDKTRYPYDDDYNCLAWQHCEQSKIHMEETKDNYTIRQCDYIVLVKNKLTISQAFIFVFVTFLLTSHMCVDIEEATIEEALLRKKRATISNISALILLVSLRLRRLVLPWAIALAVVVVTLTDDLTMKNILLNVVALEFILNADTLVLKFCYEQPSVKERVHDESQQREQLDEESKIEQRDIQVHAVFEIGSSEMKISTPNENDEFASSYEEDEKHIFVREGVDYSWWGPRVESFVIGLVVVITVLKAELVADFLNDVFYKSRHGMACVRLFWALWFMLVYGSLSTCIAHALCHFITKMRVLLDKNLLAENNSGSGDQVGEAQDENRDDGGDEKGNFLCIILDTLFQSLASLCAFYLYASSLFLVDWSYFNPEEFYSNWDTDDHQASTYYSLALLVWMIYTAIGLIFKNGHISADTPI